MNGYERVSAVLSGRQVDRIPCMPILHSALAAYSGIPLGEYLGSARVMADTTLAGCQRLGLDGVQLSMGVTAEAEALGAHIEQPHDGPPRLLEPLLAGMDPSSLAGRDPRTGGRMPLYYEAVQRVADSIGSRTFMLATLRGPLLMASQLCGVQELLITLAERPEDAAELLDYCTRTAAALGGWLLGSGAHGLVLGEATCSPSFIAPALYRRLVLPRHRHLVACLHQTGWQHVGLHICGNITPVLEDVISTGVDLIDIDSQVPAERALAISAGRCALRGNLDPSADFFLGTPDDITRRTLALRTEVLGHRWIISSGCDIPPGTPASILDAFAQANRA